MAADRAFSQRRTGASGASRNAGTLSVTRVRSNAPSLWHIESWPLVSLPRLPEEARRRGMRLYIAQEVHSASLVKRSTACGDFCMVATWPWVATEVAAGELSAARTV